MAHRGSSRNRDPGVPFDPFGGIRRRERRSWTASAKQVQQEHDADQLATLRGLAASGTSVTGVTGFAPIGGSPNGASSGLAMSAPAEMVIAGRRLRAGRIHRRSLTALSQAVATIASVPLTAVGRYGPYWVLTFRLATEQLVVLVDHLTLLPEWNGPGGRGVSTGPLANLGA